MIDCNSCKFWVVDENSGLAHSGNGYCRRHSPGVRPNNVSPIAFWPITNFDEGCGEGEENA